MNPIIDTHTHVYFPDFDADRPAVMERALQAGVTAMLMPCVDRLSCPAMMRTAAEYPHCRPMMGLHPTAVRGDWEQELMFVKEQLALAPPQTFAAIGEVGMDAYWSREFIGEQKAAFAALLALADEYGLPVVIHCRDAFEETFEVLKNHKTRLRGVFHAFSGNIDTYRQIRDLGNFKIGVGGVVTFKNAHLAEAVRDIPLCDILLETDAPYLAPVPLRGRRNESAYLTHVVQKIADLKQTSPEEICRATSLNAAALFGL